MLDFLALLSWYELLTLLFYFGFLGFIFAYSMIQLYLLFSYRVSLKKPQSVESDPLEWPTVTIQLPIYNERYVAERLIDAVCKMDFPTEKLEIQVLDDSTDETVEIVASKVEQWRSEGIDIQHVQRPDRIGYKAGALAYGLEKAKGSLIAIFDADFLPPKDFLKRTVPAFREERLGVVQTRWEHINESFSWLTRLQAFGLNAHFTVEQGGRAASGCFINFNGTAGVWRKACIQDAGGWSSDTLTEDLDLSYRAQLKGWRFAFMEDVGAPAELPEAMSALKTQQYRWTKGAAECTMKNLPRVLGAKGLRFHAKINAVFHLMNSFIFICVIGTSLLSIPVLFIKQKVVAHSAVFGGASLFLLSMLALVAFYWQSFRRMHPDAGVPSFVRRFLLFLSMSMGMSLHNAIAVLEGYLGRKTPFVRTPKFNSEAGNSWKRNIYLARSIPALTWVELGLFGLFVWVIIEAIRMGDYGLLPFHLLLAIGFGMVGWLGVKHTVLR